MALVPNPFGISFWDPLIQGFDASSSGSPSGATRVDWKETPDCHVFKADVPGMKKEDVKVEVGEGSSLLQIRGERGKDKEDDHDRHHGDKWHRMERSIGKFFRRFRLPENARMERAKATMEDGVLTVTVPKEEGKKPGVKTVMVAG